MNKFPSCYIIFSLSLSWCTTKVLHFYPAYGSLLLQSGRPSSIEVYCYIITSPSQDLALGNWDLRESSWNNSASKWYFCVFCDISIVNKIFKTYSPFYRVEEAIADMDNQEIPESSGNEFTTGQEAHGGEIVSLWGGFVRACRTLNHPALSQLLNRAGSICPEAKWVLLVV